MINISQIENLTESGAPVEGHFSRKATAPGSYR
jgi:hypothetical protein